VQEWWGLVEVLSRYFPGETEERHEYTSIRIVDTPAEIRPGHIHTIRQKRYG
jgi:hypothetical protein